jgi:tetratricopeptide (TPR) repeat protein
MNEMINAKQKTALILSGLLMSLIIIEVSLRAAGFVYLSIKDRRNMKSIKERGEYRILSLGESTTDGQWPMPLEEILNERCPELKINVIDCGVGGTNTGVILSMLSRYIRMYRPDMIITMMGVNDDPSSIALPVTPLNPYTDIRSFIRSLKVYKLLKIIRLSLAVKIKNLNKLQEEGILADNTTNEKKGETEPKADEKDGSITNVKEEPIDKDPEMKRENVQEYIELGTLYREQGKFGKAEEMFNKVLEMDPGNEWSYIELGKLYGDQRQSGKAEEMIKRALKLNPENEQGYIALGVWYKDQRQYSKAEEMLKKALEMNPENAGIYIDLGLLYKEQRKYGPAEEKLKKSLTMDPGNDQGYIDLGNLYMEQKQYGKAEKMLKKALEMNPGNKQGYVALGTLYTAQEKYSKAEGILKEALELNPGDKYIYHFKIELEQRKNDIDRSGERVFSYYLPVTAANYRKLRDIADDEKIQLVCVQYPMCRLEPLQKLLGSDPGIIFVDNEQSFIEAAREEGYYAYFWDILAWGFGHCTEKGNRLLAQNIADVIIREVFNKRISDNHQKR